MPLEATKFESRNKTAITTTSTSTEASNVSKNTIILYSLTISITSGNTSVEKEVSLQLLQMQWAHQMIIIINKQYMLIFN